MIRNYFFYVLIIAVAFAAASCKKGPGVGGTSSIKGKVYTKDYNPSFTILESEYYEANEDVFIIYGSETTFHDDRVRTSYDGSYEFRYLRKGKYTIYVNSADSTRPTYRGTIPVIHTVEITEDKKVYELPDLIKFK